MGILRRENKVLVAKRPSHQSYSGYWEFPGGKVEENESSEAALKRELYEELGIMITLATPWFQYQHVYPDKTVLLNLWLVNAFNHEPRSQEQQELRWVTFSQLLSLQLLDGNLMILDPLESLLK